GILMGLTLLLMFLCWAIVLLDMIFSPVRKKFLWIALMVVLPYFVPLFYLLRRKKKIPGHSGRSGKFHSLLNTVKSLGKR
ncbi:MAG TPA: PLDc N-terminal domain-containing protein, partial [Salinimicrobium sp.]|nr:PLDc N-terminal domain-containing protein [Salinimicrobium sp.]